MGGGPRQDCGPEGRRPLQGGDRGRKRTVRVQPQTSGGFRALLSQGEHSVVRSSEKRNLLKRLDEDLCDLPDRCFQPVSLKPLLL